MFRRNVLAFLVVGVSAVMFACSDSPVEPTPELLGIEFDKQSVTIDGVTEGRDVSQTFLIMNRGKQAAVVKNVEVLDASECDQVVVPQSSFSVPPGGISVMSVLMQGHRPGASPHTVTIGVQTEEGGANQARLAITMQGVSIAPGVQSGPRLGVDHEFTDIGNVPYNVPMHERFEVFNYGDETLHIDGIPLVRTLQGCWQPIPVVGPTTLQPGESVTLDIPLHMGMHVGMGGQHEFAIDIKSNDPINPTKTVIWKFFIAD